MAFLESRFRLAEAKTTVRREILGGATTYFAMAYVLFANPTILKGAGMDPDAVFFATVFASVIAMVAMALLANYPIALAPGMGVNAYFAFVICGAGGLGLDWQEALGATLVAGLAFLLLAGVGLRERLLHALPRHLQSAIAVGIGLFLLFLGLQWSGLVVGDKVTLVRLGDLHADTTLVALFGLAAVAALTVRRVTGAILITIAATTALGLVCGVVDPPDEWWHTPRFGAMEETLFALRFPSPFEKPEFLTAIFVILFLDLFDTVGTLVGVGTRAGLMRNGRLLRAERAFTSDAVGTTAGALLGTSTVTSYIESAAGVAQGARTGLSTLVVAALFLVSLFLQPLVKVVCDAPFVVGPVLIVVGLLMMRSVKEIPWEDPAEGLPALFAICMPLFFSITDGIALACIAHVFLRLVAGRIKEVPWLMLLVTGALLARYIWLV